jgi:hypothetical protein
LVETRKTNGFLEYWAHGGIKQVLTEFVYQQSVGDWLAQQECPQLQFFQLDGQWRCAPGFLPCLNINE